MASSGRTATTKAMGKGSTQHQHLVQTEVPKKLLEEWLALWSEHYELADALRVELRPHRAGSELLELGIVGERRREAGQRRLRPDPGPARPQHPLGARPEHLRRGAAQEAPDDADPPVPDPPLQGRLGALRHADRGQPVPGGEDEGARHLHARSTTEVGQIIVADVNRARIDELLAADRVALGKLIRKEG